MLVDDTATFEALADQWRAQRGTSSSVSEMVLCAPYQSIIGMGPRAIGLIIKELRKEGDAPDHWFWALQVLTGENPVREEHEGNLRQMAEDWLEWAANKGYAE